MAGKRHDQYQIAPSEAGTTDYKRYPEDTHGQEQDMRNTEGDKQRLAQSRKDAQGQPFPPDVPSPSAEAQRAAKRARGQLPDEEHDRSGE